MKDLRFALGAVAVLLVAGCTADTPADPSTAAPSPAGPEAARAAIPGQYIVVFERSVTDAPGLARRLVQESGGTMRFAYQHAIKGFSAELSEAAVERLRAHPQVAYVEANGIARADETQSPATWGIDRVDQRDLPLSNSYTYSTTASNVTIYILDTGIRTTHNEFDGVSANRASIGFDAIGDGQNGQDCNGHGTHVAGTAAGATYGVAKGAKLVAVRVLNCGGSGTWDQVIAGIDWVTANAVKPAVANMSLGGGFIQSVNDAVSQSVASGVFYSVSAGNGDFLGRPLNACNNSPASTPTAMTVGSTTSSDAESSFSNYGTCVDILAPGSSITSAWYTGDNATNTISGTSMAAPHVAGVAALWLAAHPGDSPAATTSALKSSATSNTITLHSSSAANGTPNLFLYSLLDGGGDPDPDPDPDPNQPPTASFTSSCSTLTCTFTSTSTDGDGSIVAHSWNFGDGTSGSGASVTHTYARQGSYSVRLTVTDDDGATATATQSVRVRRFR